MTLSSFEIAVVVPTHNREDLIGRLLEALESQRFSPDKFQVVMCNDASIDGTADILSRARERGRLHLTVVQGRGGGPAYARNRALENVEAPLVAFTDDDTIPSPDWLASHVAYLAQHPEMAGVGGRVVRVNDTAVGRYIDHSGAMRHAVSPDGTVRYLVTANAAYRTEWLRRMNGFNESITWPGGEDPDLSFRIIAAGGRLGLNLGAELRHHHRDTLSGVARMFYHHGMGLAMNIRSGTKKRKNSALRTLVGVLARGSWEVLGPRVAWRDKPLFLLCNMVRSIAFARGYAVIMKRPSGDRTP